MCLRSLLSLQFLYFSIVGTIGFIVDSSVLYFLLYEIELGFYVGRLFSYLGAASITWLLNRYFTFSIQRSANPAKEWFKFLLYNGVGGGVNYGVYAALIASNKYIASNPIIGVAVGSACGLIFNFTVSQLFVFRGKYSSE